MNTILKYMKGGQARFDFRVPDGLGNWVYPDWDDEDLKVEFHDSAGQLRFTATAASDPALVPGDDYDEITNSDGGAFVVVEAINLDEFALGVCESRVYARVSGVDVLPYPTMLAAFEVVADVGEDPLYTTVDRVRLEVPGAWPDQITDEMVTLAIFDAGREMDAYLETCYDTPFPGIGDDPATPPLIETICRKLAAEQCREWMGFANQASETGARERAYSALARLVPSDAKPPLVRLSGYKGPMAAYLGELRRSDDQAEEDRMA